jgi:Mg2+ and Co2+ transporter CorA
MESVLYYLTTLAVIAVIAVLVMGLWTMARGTSPSLSQKLMRIRVGLQLLAIVLIMSFVYFTST